MPVHAMRMLRAIDNPMLVHSIEDTPIRHTMPLNVDLHFMQLDAI